ncbi:MAG: glycosyltransferase family 2 protein [Phycisphaerales bacterium]
MTADDGRSRPLPLSVAIVCRNNEGTIGRTLESVRGLASEIVAVDSGSVDGTTGLLESAGARVIRSAWLGHVKTKQSALEACTQPWVLCLDSDESVERELADSIRAALGGDPDGARTQGYELNRVVWYRGRALRHAWQPEWRLRLVRRGAAAWGGMDPHDTLSLTSGGRPARLRGTLRHDSFQTFAEHLGKQLAYARLSAEGMRREGRRGSYVRLALSPAGALLKQLVVKSAWRDGYPGWLAAGTTAAGALMKHMILLELEHGETIPGESSAPHGHRRAVAGEGDRAELVKSDPA